MLLKKAVEKKQEAPETNPYEWPESYYMETDAHQRKALLEAQISSGDAGADNRLRKELWELRYQTQKKGDVKDNFFRLAHGADTDVSADHAAVLESGV